jgi:hypothetical protein
LAKVDLAALLVAHIVQAHGAAGRILPKLSMTQEHRGAGFLEAGTFVALHQTGVEEIDFRFLEQGARNVAVEWPQREHDVQRLQDFQIAPERGWRNLQVARQGSQRGLAGLPGAGKKDHLAGQIDLDEGR